MIQYENTMALAEELAMQIPGIKEILEIKGVGIIMATGFIIEVGDIKGFDHPKQIQKLAGLSIKEKAFANIKSRSNN